MQENPAGINPSLTGGANAGEKIKPARNAVWQAENEPVVDGGNPPRPFRHLRMAEHRTPDHIFESSPRSFGVGSKIGYHHHQPCRPAFRLDATGKLQICARGKPQKDGNRFASVLGRNYAVTLVSGAGTLARESVKRFTTEDTEEHRVVLIRTRGTRAGI